MNATRAMAWAVVAAVALGPQAPAGNAAERAKKAQGGADSILVRLDKEVITTGMVQRRIEELPEQVRSQFVTPEGRQRLVERMVEERVWLLTAMKKGIAARPDIQRQLEQQRRDLLIRSYINELMAGNPAPSDSEARAYYDAHAADYKTPATVSISHIQCKTENEAKRIRSLARQKQNWPQLVSKFSTDTLTRSRDGALGPTTREGMFAHLGRQPALAETAFALGAGGIGGPIRTEHGWHVIRVDAVTPESERPFDQVRGTIVRQLSTQNAQAFYQARLAEAKSALGVRADSAAIRRFLAQKRTAREMFADAQAAGAAAARIEAYQKLLHEYPDSDVSPQAAFMIGFIQSEELKDYDAAEKSFGELLAKYPRSELAASARWMMAHMRNESAPDVMNLDADSTAADSQRATPPAARPKPQKATRGRTGKP
jgi:peptidyl-prolyl cis-trans isomerase C